MSNYQEGAGPYSGEPPRGEGGGYQGADPYQGGATHPGEPGYRGAPEPTQTTQYQGGPPWERGPGPYRGGGGPRFRQRPPIRSTFKTTEFWIFVVVSLGLLIAAAVTDERSDNQGFGAAEAWWYVTVLAVGYMLSRGLAKFGGRGRGDDHSDQRHGHQGS